MNPRFRLVRAARVLTLLFALALVAGPLARADGQEEADSFDLLGYFPTTELQKRIASYQFRATVLSGAVHYSSVNAASDASVSIDHGSQLGFRLEADRWFQLGGSNRRPLGVSADFQDLFVGAFDGITGNPLRYLSGSLLLGLRFMGYGHTQPWAPEGTLLVGPAIEAFPSMHVSFDLSRYTLAVPLEAGLRAGVRLRFPIIPRFQMLSLETAAFATFPMRLIDQGDGTTDPTDTRSYGGTALLDLKLMTRTVLGFGFYYGQYSLGYTATGSSVPDQIRFTTESWAFSLRLIF